MLINGKLLKIKIREKYGSVSAFAKELGVHRNTLGRLINGTTAYTTFLIVDVIRNLELSNEDVFRIFLPQNGD